MDTTREGAAMRDFADFRFHSGVEIRVASALAACALLLCGCISASVPEGYAGPVADIADTHVANDNDSVSFFYLARINGKRIDNSLAKTTEANAGMGLRMRARVMGRAVPARTTIFTITGRTHYAAPILEFLNTVHEVSGKVRFTPQPDHLYLVKGVLSDRLSSVWIEDEAGNVMGKKIASKNSRLGFFEK
jgi:hypothetical protein